MRISRLLQVQKEFLKILDFPRFSGRVDVIFRKILSRSKNYIIEKCLLDP